MQSDFLSQTLFAICHIASIMKIERVVLYCTILLSLLISFAIADGLTGEENTGIDYEFEVHINGDQDLEIADVDYDYEEVTGNEIPKNIIPFHKHPGVYAIDLEGILYALDSDNGEILWAKKVSDKIIKVTESPPPPANYGEPLNGTSLQRIFNLF